MPAPFLQGNIYTRYSAPHMKGDKIRLLSIFITSEKDLAVILKAECGREIIAQIKATNSTSSWCLQDNYFLEKSYPSLIAEIEVILQSHILFILLKVGQKDISFPRSSVFKASCNLG
ncbi:uncharacterized protein isoform X2 [Rhodnius prolixus]